MNVKVLFGISVLLIAFSSCNGDAQREADSLRAEKDSLRHVYESQRLDMSAIESYLNAMSESIDSISQQEGLLFVRNLNEDGQPFSRRQIMENLTRYQQLLQRQHSHIEQLRDSMTMLSSRGQVAALHIAKLNKMVEFLNAQLAAKEQEVERLQAEVSRGKRDIAELQSNVVALSSNVDQLKEKNELLAQSNQELDKEINVAYLRIGTKKDLKEANITKGIFRTKADYQNLDKTKFQQIDKRKETTLSIGGKSPKLITEKPEGTYTIEEKVDGTSVLTINDPERFWATSSFLIIQIK